MSSAKTETTMSSIFSMNSSCLTNLTHGMFPLSYPFLVTLYKIVYTSMISSTETKYPWLFKKKFNLLLSCLFLKSLNHTLSLPLTLIQCHFPPFPLPPTTILPLHSNANKTSPSSETTERELQSSLLIVQFVAWPYLVRLVSEFLIFKSVSKFLDCEKTAKEKTTWS